MLFSSYSILGQIGDSIIIYEQRALYFLCDSILNKHPEFIKSKIHFNGQVESIVTEISSFHMNDYPNTEVIEDEIQQWFNSTDPILLIETRPQFQLTLDDNIKKKVRRKYSKKSKVLRLKIFQVKKIKNRYFVTIQSIEKKGNNGHYFYLVFNDVGNVVWWTQNAYVDIMR